MIASISVTPSRRAASRAWPKMSAPLSRISAPDFDVAEARRAGAMSRSHHLLGLAFAAIGHAPQRPVLAARDGRAGIPELRRNPAVAWVFQHAHAAPVANLPARLAAELKVVALVVDRPAPVGLHVNGMVHVEDLIERLFARLQANVGHADQRQARPAVGPHAAVGPRLPDLGGGLARGHVSHKLPHADNLVSLRRHAFV